jgi:hypothetical protein
MNSRSPEAVYLAGLVFMGSSFLAFFAFLVDLVARYLNGRAFSGTVLAQLALSTTTTVQLCVMWCPGAESNHRHGDFQAWKAPPVHCG